ncbi:transcription factor 25 [Quillaja saponaria]|uniref:Transcription factor 25 n=1 Tax=Quillaja saponaria TaxID=32244 RepID=A0AAD7LSE6_QUISA|nr:transcription factor 25 [Quillaja saponaria]
MSARALRKFLNEQQQRPQEEENQLNGGEELESPEPVSRPTVNPFDLLNDHDSELDEGDELKSPYEMVIDYKDKEEQSTFKITSVASNSNPKSKKKKKKKNKEVSSSSKDTVEKDLDVILENLDVNSSTEQHLSSKAKGVYAKDCNNAVKQYSDSILQVDPKYLNAENELRRIFGSKVVKSFESSNQAGSSRQTRGVRRGNHNLRKTVLVTPANHWQRWDGSLSMEFLETRDGFNYFRYAHSSSYTQAQRAFEAAKAINDINGLASILLYNPYHVESLLTMAEYFKIVGEHQMSADAIAKCLYALECAWHPMFTPLRGNCQLKFSHDTNKPLFSTLFFHMKNLDRRGCHRSALEVCKLLLGLDSDDPMGAIFCIDYFSLRAEEYRWLEKFSDDYKSDNSLWLFPNFSYSLSICRYYLEKEASRDAKKATSTELLKQALMLHPSVLKKLVSKVPLKDRAWTNFLKDAFFRSEQTGIPSLDHLINIYVERNYLIWRLPDLHKLLLDAAQLVIETLENNKGDIKDWTCVRKEAFSSDKNEYGHLMVSDFSDSVTSIPPENLQNFMGDPRMREVVQNHNQVAHPHENGHAPRDVANRSALAVLFESMLPWVSYGDEEDGGVDDDQLNGLGQGNEEF